MLEVFYNETTLQVVNTIPKKHKKELDYLIEYYESLNYFVSEIFYTIFEKDVEFCYYDFYGGYEDPEFYISLKKRASKKAKLMLSLVLNEFSVLATRYPEYVKIERLEDD